MKTNPSPLPTLLLGCSSLLVASIAHAADGTWNADSAGNWSDTTKWASSTVANGADFTALFDDVITANRTVTLDSSRTLGNITAADTTHNYTIQSNTVTLDVTSGSPTLSVPTDRTLTISSVIAGNDGFTKTGAGLATLSGSNTVSGNVTVSGGAVEFSQSGNRTFDSLSGSGDFFRRSGDNTLSILDASAFQGKLRTFAGGNSTHTVEFKSLGDAGGAGNLQAAGGTGDSNQRTKFRLYGDVGPLTLTNRSIEILSKNPTPSNWSGRGTRLENNNGTAANKWVINTDLINETDRDHELELLGSNSGDNEFAGVISDSTGIGGLGAFYSTQTGVLQVIKDGGGKWILSGANTYTGNTTIINGTLEIRGAGQLGGGTYAGNITNTDTTPDPFTFDSSASQTLSGVISGTMAFIKDGVGTLSLTGSATHTGGTTVDDGTLSLGNGTNNANLSDFAALSVATGAVLDLNYSGSDAVFNLNLGGSPMAAGQYGHTTSGATNGGAGVGFYDAFLASNSGTINNLAGDLTSISVAFWDGGSSDIGTNGDAASDGGTGTWDTTILNWDYGTVAHAAYLDTTSTTAYFGGSTGTVTLDADMSIENLNIQVPNAGGSAYFIGDAAEDNTLTFGGNKTITVTATGTGTNQRHVIRAGIAGSPTLNITGPASNGADSFSLLPPAGVTMTLGPVNMLNDLASNKRLILGGESTGNVVDTVAWATTGNQLMLTKAGTGSWTINNDVLGIGKSGRLYVEQGTLTLGGTSNFFTHKVGVSTVRESTFTASGTASKLEAKGTFTINDNREWFYVQNMGTLSPGPGVETLNVTWNANNTTSVNNGAFNMQTGSTYEWGVASSVSTDVVNVTTGGSNNANLILGNMTIKITDAGAATAIANTDQLTLFTYETGAQIVARSIGTISFDTTALGAGWTVGSLAVTDDGAGTIYLTGLSFTAGGAPEIAVEQPAASDIADGGSKAFGTVTLGSDTSLVFTIKNTGTANLNLSSTPKVVVSGTNAADFTVTADASTPVAAAGSTTFTVEFAPGGAGARTAELTIANDDADENPFNITVTGTGQTVYDAWANGGGAFGVDDNGDGVSNGLAWLLGAADPDEDATDRLPTVTEVGGDLVLDFDCLPVAARGGATLKVAHSNTLASFTPTTNAVPDATGADAGGVVSYVVSGPSGSPSVNTVTATIDSSAAAGGKLFGRLEATE